MVDGARDCRDRHSSGRGDGVDIDPCRGIVVLLCLLHRSFKSDNRAGLLQTRIPHLGVNVFHKKLFPHKWGFSSFTPCLTVVVRHWAPVRKEMLTALLLKSSIWLRKRFLQTAGLRPEGLRP